MHAWNETSLQSSSPEYVVNPLIYGLATPLNFPSKQTVQETTLLL